MSDILEIKREQKKKIPKFSAQDSHKKARIADRWRKPRGIDAKMRLQLKGYRKIVKQGYMTPKAVKHVHMKTGLKTVLVSNKNDIEGINNKESGVILSGKLGNLKRFEIVKLCKEKEITIINIKDVDDFIKKFDEASKKKKEEKQKLEKEKQKKEAEKKSIAKKKEEKKDDLASKVEDTEEKKIKDKKEKDKVLISTE